MIEQGLLTASQAGAHCGRSPHCHLVSTRGRAPSSPSRAEAGCHSPAAADRAGSTSSYAEG